MLSGWREVLTQPYGGLSSLLGVLSVSTQQEEGSPQPVCQGVGEGRLLVVTLWFTRTLGDFFGLQVTDG